MGGDGVETPPPQKKTQSVTHPETHTHSLLSHPVAGVALGDQALKGNNPLGKGKEGEVGKGLRAWTQEEPEVAGKRIWNLLGSQAPLPPIFSIPEPYTATPFVAWELSPHQQEARQSGEGVCRVQGP